MDFKLTEEEELFQKTVREFAETKLMPMVRKIDEQEKIPEDLMQEMARLQLLGVTIPDKYGGAGGNFMMATLSTIEIGRGDISMATAVFHLLITGWSHVLNKYGTEECKAEVLPKVVKGKAFMGIATTEAGGGSDLLNTKSTARKEGDYYVLNGEKTYISGVRETSQLGDGGHLSLFKTAPELGHRGFSFFYVPLQTEGIETTFFRDMGRMGLSTGGLSYNNVKIPKHYLLGEENRGWYCLMDGFNAARTLVAAACIGAGTRALELGMEYIKQRVAFGSPLGKFEAIQFELADLHAKLEMAKDMVLKAAWLIDTYPSPNKAQLSEITKTVAIVKLFAPQIAFECCKAAMIWCGAAGYTKDMDIEMGLRGVMSYLVGAEGGLNIMRIIIARELLGKEFIPYK